MNTEVTERDEYKKSQKKDEEIFILNLIFLREQKKWTQQEITVKIGHGLKFKTYQSWEEKRGFPPIFFCRRIAQLFELRLNDLLTVKLS